MISSPRFVLISALGLALALPAGSARATQPAAQAPGEGEKEVSDRGIERLVQKMEASCATASWGRSAMPRPDCPGKMETVAKLGDRAVPVLQRHLVAFAQSAGERPPRDDRGEILIGVLQRIGSERAVGAMVQLIGEPAVQKGAWGGVNSLHVALNACTKEGIASKLASRRDRAEAASRWKKWWEDRHGA